ncbi:MAG: permease-like cell division protein FtsX [Chitinophagaceae bacterium]
MKTSTYYYIRQKAIVHFMRIHIRPVPAGVILLVLLLLAGCNSKKITLNRLRTVNWTKLDTGIGYVSTRSGPTTGDSVRFRMVGFISIKGQVWPMEDEKITALLFFGDAISRSIKDKLPGSLRGYLRFNLQEMWRKEVTINVYLSPAYDTASIRADLEQIRQLPRVAAAGYVSKDSARKKYVADGNGDWSALLDENPLPSSIEIHLDGQEITEEQYKEIEAMIRNHVQGISDIAYPKILFGKWDGRYLIAEYRRD